MTVAHLVEGSKVIIMGRQKGSKGDWKPMNQIKVKDLEDAFDQVSKRSDTVDRGLDLAVQVTTLYTDIERIGKELENADSC